MVSQKISRLSARWVSGLRRRAVAFLSKEGILVFLSIAICTALIHYMAFLLPALNWLPNADVAESFLKVLWQVHASVLAITVVVVTILVTVIANDDNRTRTWKLYAKKTRFLLIVWFNLIAIVSEGIASLQTSHVLTPLISSDKIGNLILTEGFLLVVSLIAAAWLFNVTFNFLRDDYIEKLSEEDIISAMPEAVESDLRRRQEFMKTLQNGGANGH